MPEDNPIILWQTGPCWNTSSSSPFCTKLETWLRMAEVPYVAKVLLRPPRSSTGKVPYIERPDGTLLADSGAIIDALSVEHGVTLDDGLDARARALHTAFTRLLEDHLYWAIAYDRWVVDAHWSETKVAYFGALPWPLRSLVPPWARRAVLRAFHGQGFGRLETEAVYERARRDLLALAEVIGQREHVLDQRSSLDATAYAFITAALRPPWDGPLQRAVREHPGLVAFCEAIEREYW